MTDRLEPALFAASVLLVKACLRQENASKARAPVTQFQQALTRLGGGGRSQAAEIARLLEHDARTRKLRLHTPTQDGIGPTPETKARLKRDVLKTWYERQRLSDAGYGAATEIRDFADSIAMSEHPAQDLAKVHVDGGKVGLAPAERLTGRMSTREGKRFFQWCQRMAATPVIAEQAPDIAREEAAAAASMSVRTASMLELVMAVAVDAMPISAAARMVRARKELVQELVTQALHDYAAADPDRLAAKAYRQLGAIERAEKGNPLQLHEIVFLNTPEERSPDMTPRLDPTIDRPEPGDQVGEPDQKAPWVERDNAKRNSPRIPKVAGGRIGKPPYRPRPLDEIDAKTRRAIRSDVLGGLGTKLEIARRYAIEPAAIAAAVAAADQADVDASFWWAQQMDDEATVITGWCPGHVASARDPKVCGRCGIHIDELRPPDGEADAGP